MLVSGIKSRPRYGTLAPDLSGRRHLLVCDAEPDPTLPLLTAMPSDAPFEVWAVENASRILQAPMAAALGPFAMTPFRAKQQLLDRLACLLASETILLMCDCPAVTLLMSEVSISFSTAVASPPLTSRILSALTSKSPAW